MRRRKALLLALATGCLVVFLALSFALLQPSGAALPQYP